MLEKDLKKFKMIQESIQDRVIASRPGGKELLAETEEQREEIRVQNLKENLVRQDAHIVSADQKRL